MTMPKLDEKPVIDVLNRLLEAELAGVVRYTHYSFLVFGFGRIPIVSWLRAQAEESMAHAQQLGEWITTLGADPSLAIGPLLDSHQHDIAAMLRESLDAERAALELYKELLHLVQGRSIALEEFARQLIHAEELHAAGAPARSAVTADGRYWYTWETAAYPQPQSSVGFGLGGMRIGGGGATGVGVGVGMPVGSPSPPECCERTLVFDNGRVVDQSWVGPPSMCAEFKRR